MNDHHANPVPYPHQQAPYLPVRSRQSPPVSHPVPRQFPPPVPPQFPARFPAPFPQQARKPRTRLVLMAACVAAFAAAAVFAVLYVGADGDRDAAVARLDERSAQLADVRARLTAAEDARADATARNSGLAAEETALRTCVDAVQRYLWDGLEGTARDAALDAMFTACQ